MLKKRFLPLLLVTLLIFGTGAEAFAKPSDLLPDLSGFYMPIPQGKTDELAGQSSKAKLSISSVAVADDNRIETIPINGIPGQFEHPKVMKPLPPKPCAAGDKDSISLFAETRGFIDLRNMKWIRTELVASNNICNVYIDLAAPIKSTFTAKNAEDICNEFARKGGIYDMITGVFGEPISPANRIK